MVHTYDVDPAHVRNGTKKYRPTGNYWTIIHTTQRPSYPQVPKKGKGKPSQDLPRIHSISAAMKFSWNNSSQQPRLVVTAEDADFDQTTLQHWREEGFQVSYLPFTATRKAYIQQLHHLADPLELGEKYAIVGQASHKSSLHTCNLLPIAFISQKYSLFC